MFSIMTLVNKQLYKTTSFWTLSIVLLGSPTFLACASRLALTMAASSWPCSRVMLRTLRQAHPWHGSAGWEVGKSH